MHFLAATVIDPLVLESPVIFGPSIIWSQVQHVQGG